MTPALHSPKTWFAERLALYYGALFMVYGAHITYFPLWLSWRGLTPQELGFITALPILMRIVIAPSIAAYADRHGNHRAVMIVLSITSAVLALIISQCATFWTLLLTVVPFAIAISSIGPLTETLAMAGARAEGHDYGRMRLWGSLTFLVATVLTGRLFDAFGASVGIWGMVGATLMTVGASLLLPHAPHEGPAPPTVGLKPPQSLVWPLLRQPVFAMTLLAVGAIFGSHAAFYTFGALHLKGQGVSATAFGGLWAVSIIAEVALFAVSQPIVDRYGPIKLIMAAAAAGVIRWGAMSLDPSLATVVVLQVLHAATYGAAHLGIMHFIARAVPERGAGQAQALYSTIGNGLFTGLATLAAGQLYPLLAGQTFLIMAALSACGLAATIWVGKTWDGKVVLR
jgi:MFS transporter, PPP family, 3-phenylpropionic acid transporter